MAEIKPFPGIKYNINLIKEINMVIAPPYDVIDQYTQKKLYKKSPYNIIRLEYGLTNPEDGEANSVYTRAADEFNTWLEEGILLKDEQPALYLYELEFNVDDTKVIRRGFFACVKVEDFKEKTILPHEETLSKPKEDRLKLLRVCKANFSPIFGLYPDKQCILEKIFDTLDHEADMDFLDEEENRHRIWTISDRSIINTLESLLKGKQIFIADGHHRYETALEFSKEMATLNKKGYDYVMMGLVNIYNPGLLVLPTHRLVKNLKEFNLKIFLEKIAQDFTINEFPFDKNSREKAFHNMYEVLEKKSLSNNAFGLYGGNNCFYLLTLKDINTMNRSNLNRSSEWKSLDVSVLQVMIMEKLLHIEEAQREKETHLTYARDEKFALEAVDTGSHQLAFFMNPTKVEEITTVAGGGERMPQKSTFFYPKLVTGLVINQLPLE